MCEKKKETKEGGGGGKDASQQLILFTNHLRVWSFCPSSNFHLVHLHGASVVFYKRQLLPSFVCW